MAIVDVIIATGDVLRVVTQTSLQEVADRQFIQGEAIVVSRARISASYWPEGESRRVFVRVEDMLVLAPNVGGL